MEDHHVGPFVKATTDVLKLQAGVELKPEDESAGSGLQAPPEVSVIIGITGRLNGSVSIGMSRQTAKEIASAMAQSDLLDMKVIASILTALGTAITSEASITLWNMGLECYSLFPTLVFGEDISVTTPIKQKHSVYLNSDCGQIEIKVSFLERGLPMVN